MTFRKFARLQLLCLATFFISAACSVAVDKNTAPVDLFLTQHQAGFRLGVWSNQGDLPPSEGDITSDGIVTGFFKTSINSASAYVEGYFGYRLNSRLVGELSLGTVNRGSVTLADTTGIYDASDVGNLMIYPILVQLKLYAPKIPNSNLHPFILAGGGIHYGRRNVQFSNSQNYYANWQEETATDFNYVIGGGFDWPIASSIGLDFTVKYMPINMSLVVIDKYDALAFTVGVKYLYKPKQGN